MKNDFKKLNCLNNLTILDLSHNLILLDLDGSDLDGINFTDQIQYVDLSFNSIEFLNTSLFVTNQNKSRFPKLEIFKINNNRLISFDLLIPITFPNTRFLLDVSNNQIKSFKNQLKRSFRENPFYYDLNENRTVNMANNQLSILSDETFTKEYYIFTPSDLEIFLQRISSLDLFDQSLMCECMACLKDTVALFRQINKQSLDISVKLLKKNCSNLNGQIFNYTCGVN